MQMEPTPDTASPSKWTLAMRDGLLLSLVTIVCTTLSTLADFTLLNILSWIVKLVGSIWLLWYFMKRYGLSHPEEPRTTGYGILVCLFSSIVCAVFTYLAYRFFFPQMVEEISAQVTASLASTPGLTAEMEDAVYKVMDNLPQIVCGVTLIWNFLLGLAFSAIIGASTARKDPFGDQPQKPEDKVDELA